jgi:hypothetical protein
MILFYKEDIMVGLTQNNIKINIFVTQYLCKWLKLNNVNVYNSK